MTGCSQQFCTEKRSISVVIPCFRVTKHILAVLAEIGPEVDRIYCVDDACPDGSGDLVAAECRDPRVSVLRNQTNQGVGGAVLAGYREAALQGADIIVKIDGDGQMDPALILTFVQPIVSGDADYTKGNRFWDLSEIKRMPLMRRLGNLALSFMTKLSSGYWDIFDPTNGYTAIHSSVARQLPIEAISKRYFFETDMLFRLNIIRAVVIDVPMHARYADETSNLSIGRVLPEFTYKHIRNFAKRISYNYFLRDLSIASLELLAGAGLLFFGILFGLVHWLDSMGRHESTPVGTIMIATVSLVSGLQFLLAFLGFDISSVPKRPLHIFLSRNGTRT